jgi:hypothetical protein
MPLARINVFNLLTHLKVPGDIPYAPDMQRVNSKASAELPSQPTVEVRQISDSDGKPVSVSRTTPAPKECISGNPALVVQPTLGSNGPQDDGLAEQMRYKHLRASS